MMFTNTLIDIVACAKSSSMSKAMGLRNSSFKKYPDKTRKITDLMDIKFETALARPSTVAVKEHSDSALNNTQDWLKPFTRQRKYC